MNVHDKLSTSLDRRDEKANIELALKIARTKDEEAVKELVGLLGDKDKNIQSDSIKVLYETGERCPELIAGYAKDFIALLDHKNNRLQWGAMTALHAIASVKPKMIFASLAKIIDVSDRGSVITKDNCAGILIKLCALKPYAEKSFTLFLEHLLKSPPNQVPMYAERAMPVVGEKNKKDFIRVLRKRFDDLEKDTQRRRLEKVIKKFS